MTDSIDRRVRRTHQLLGDALIELTLTRGYDSITIRDITDHADVAYATFFRHFNDKNDLLHATLNTLIDAIETMNYKPSEMVAEGYAVFLHVQQHSDLYRVLLNSQGAHHIIEKLKNYITDNMLKTCIPYFKQSLKHVPPSILAYQHASSIISLVSWWLAHNMEISAEDMAIYYFETVVTPYFEIDEYPEFNLPEALTSLAQSDR